jgi:hypothetical protein
MSLRLLTAFAALAVSAGPLLAENGFDCRCIYKGHYFEQGETVCIRAYGTERMARCDMLLNNSSWTFLAGDCPQARATPIPPDSLALLKARPISAGSASR